MKNISNEKLILLCSLVTEHFQGCYVPEKEQRPYVTRKQSELTETENSIVNLLIEFDFMEIQGNIVVRKVN